MALVGGGALFFSKASSTQSQINGGGTRAQLDGWASDVKSQHTLSAVLLGAGAAAGVAAGVLFLLPSGSGANAGVQGKF